MIRLAPAAVDPTGKITQPTSGQIGLAAGVYLVSYSVSATLEQPGYLQVTPYYNDRPALNYGVYGRLDGASVTLNGAATFIAEVEEDTILTLNTNSPVEVRDGAVTVTILALN